MKKAVCALLVAAAAASGAPGPVPAQEGPTIVYLVRHGETVADQSRDPALAAAGLERAGRLARMLAEAGLTAVHTTPLRRTRGTAAGVAAETGLGPRTYDPRDLRDLAARLVREGGRHLVVGHSNTTPELVRLLGGAPGDPMPETEFDRVYLLTIADGTVHTAVLGYPARAPIHRPEGTDGPGGEAAGVLARDGDVTSIDAIVAALYHVISGPPGEARDWDRLRSLFLPGARMLPVQRTPDGRVAHQAITPDEYIRGSGPLIERVGFREREIARRLEEFGDVAHVFSTYEGFRDGSDEPFVRGLNSIQLIFDGSRWWIASLAWAPERPDLPIPERYGGGP